MKHIQQETGCRVQIKGRGSGYLDARPTARAMKTCTCMLREYMARSQFGVRLTLVSSGPDPNQVEKAKELCEDLLGNVKEQYEEFKNRPPRTHGGHGGHGGPYGDRQGGGNASGPYQGYGGHGQGGFNPPAGPGGAGSNSRGARIRQSARGVRIMRLSMPSITDRAILCCLWWLRWVVMWLPWSPNLVRR